MRVRPAEPYNSPVSDQPRSAGPAGGDWGRSDMGKVAISMTTGLEDAEKVTVALLTAVGAAEQGHPCLVFMTKEAVRLSLEGIAVGTACEGCPSIPDLMKRLGAAGGRLLICPICFNAKQLSAGDLVENAEL